MSKYEKDSNSQEILQKEKERLQRELSIVYKKEIDNLPELIIDEFTKEDTALIIVDMIEGFSRIGNLKSPRVEGKIAHIANVSSCCAKKGIPIIAFADEHNETSPEFNTYGIHCLKGTKECEVVKEISDAAGDEMIRIGKNSNNGFIEEEYGKWLCQNKKIKNFIVVGDCTDICVEAFAWAMRSYFDQQNIADGRVIISEDSVATYDAPWHNGDFKHYESLINMKDKGIEIYSRIRI